MEDKPNDGFRLVPHASHKMAPSRQEVGSLWGEPRFLRVRACVLCGSDQTRSNGGERHDPALERFCPQGEPWDYLLWSAQPDDGAFTAQNSWWALTSRSTELSDIVIEAIMTADEEWPDEEGEYYWIARRVDDPGHKYEPARFVIEKYWKLRVQGQP